MKYIICVTGEAALVDDSDYEWLCGYTWYFNTRDGAVSTSINGFCTYMSRLIGDKMDLDSKLEIDHKDTNGLNNQRDNLRSATRSQNAANRNLQKNNTSGFKGVSFLWKLGKYRARIKINNKERHLGVFKTDVEAALAYNKAARESFGEYARLNEVPNAQA